jgi:hypothetical protein
MLRLARLWLAAGVALLCAAGMVTASLATFSDASHTTGWPFTAARLALLAAPDRVVPLDACPLLRSGQTCSAVATLQHSGEVSADWRVRLQGRPADASSRTLRLKLQTIFPRSRLIYEGALGDLTDTLIARDAAPGERVTVRVTVRWPAGEADPALRGTSAEPDLFVVATRAGSPEDR